MKKYKIIFWIQLTLGSFFSFASLASAASGIVAPPQNVLSNSQSVVDLFCTGFNWLFFGVIIISVIMFLVGGYTYATSNGETEKVSKATKTLTYAAIGIVVALVAIGVPSLIGSFLGITSGLSVCG